MKLSRLDPDMTAEQAAAAVLSVGDTRSKEYHEGLENRLDWHLHGKPKDAGFCRCPYAMGTAQADAWLAGQDRADFEIQRYQTEEAQL
ncbi:hypothetical protein [Modicisalibacter xianhensis]|uniref:Uncharacterized protein n=1 Tax=Modicisalibacter xianhensis TaxID=442341 RepID=A0A1I3GAH3_9GAMM|nr:hypothetical protein [Halomonas xianhensis]SFI20535.1 hypothetical protein SAMN04487959_1294 [Halomonas xianhensis]